MATLMQRLADYKQVIGHSTLEADRAHVEVLRARAQQGTGEVAG